MSNQPVSDIILQAQGGFYRRKLMTGTVLTLLADSIVVKDAGGTFVFPRADYVPSVPVADPPPIVVPPPPTGPGLSPELTGIRWTQTDPIHPDQSEGVIVGFADPIGGIGPYTWVLVDQLNAKYGVRGRGEVYGYWTKFGTTDDDIRLVCTDARGKKVTSDPIRIRKADPASVAVMMNSRNPNHNCTTDTFYNGPLFVANVGGGAHGDGRGSNGATTKPDGSAPDFLWQANMARYKVRASILPGTYPTKFTFTSPDKSDTQTLLRDLVVTQYEPLGAIEFIPITTISTASIPGTLLGYVRATTPNNVFTSKVSDPDGLAEVNSATREVRLAKTPSKAGALVLTITVTDGPATRTDTFSIPVLQGNVIPPEKMTVAFNPALDNGTWVQHIGDAKVDAVFGPGAVWSIIKQTRYAKAAETEGYPARLTINPSTGSIDTSKIMSEGQDTITLLKTDGINSCTNTFTFTTKRALKTTNYYVGKGDPKTIGRGVPADATKLPSLAEARRVCMNPHSDFKAFWVDDDPDPNWLVNDTGIKAAAGGAGDYGLRFAWQGPGRIEFLWPADGSPRVAALGGSPSNDRPGGGDMRGKGTLVLGDGDWTVVNPYIANTHGPDSTHGVEAIRRDGETYGDTTIIGGVLRDCDQGYESGLSHGIHTIDGLTVVSCGTAHVGSGACHNFYIGAVDTAIVRNVTSVGANLGHLLKCRAQTTLVEDCTLIDGLVGSSSCCADFPSGGKLIFRRNFVEKGTMAQNPFAIQYAAEGVIHEENTYQIEDNTISILTLGGSHAGANAGIAIWPMSNAKGVPVSGTITGTKFWASPKSLASVAVLAGKNLPAPHNGTVMLAAPPPLPPLPAMLGKPRPIYLHTLWGSDYYKNFEGVQQVPDRYEIVVSRSAPAGAVLCTIYARDDTNGQRASRFTAGTAAQLVRDRVYYPNLLPDPWAPDGRYGLTVRPDGSADLIVAGDLSAAERVDYVQLRFIAPDGTLCDSRYPVKVVP